ncbi:pyridoxamine 5'-phosphate oxidase family protein [Microlunatus speluncae]|uniref:pyridoxamine 5'-phosphate oxidase family protein n=1 Tax=Microlunatus speluncae TaxID=2594267 RepID=UPI0012666EDA|nr:pyridoxamine 5'-phosphate oxidase family protein [Microlunatus speluncae]
MPEALPDDVRSFLSKANPAVMATTRKDGRPITAATWYLLEADDRILINFDAERVRLQHVRRDPRCALDVLPLEDWYSHVALQLDVVELTEDTGLADIDALAKHYTGHGYPNRERPRFSARAEIRSWWGWGEFDH